MSQKNSDTSSDFDYLGEIFTSSMDDPLQVDTYLNESMASATRTYPQKNTTSKHIIRILRIDHNT